MSLLNIAAIVCIGLLVGTEFAVSAFVNPVVWKLETSAQGAAVRLFAQLLGRVMPFWYGLDLVLLAVAAWLRFRETGFGWLVVAGAIWVVVILQSVLFLVPINNRLMRLEPGVFTDTQRSEHRRWDTMHRVRVAALIVAFVCYLAGSGA